MAAPVASVMVPEMVPPTTCVVAVRAGNMAARTMANRVDGALMRRIMRVS
jgi:hypothetical protein